MIWGKQYKCTVRFEEKAGPWFFTSYSAAAMARAPTYVLNYWKRCGYHLTRRSALHYPLVDRLRSAIVNGQGALPFRNSVLNAHKLEHKLVTQGWQSYVQQHRAQPPPVGGPPRQDLFYEFTSEEYGGSVASASFLLKIFADDRDARPEFHVRQPQMTDGLLLADEDIAKHVFVVDACAFKGLYTLTNASNQVLSFSCTHGTTITKLEPMLRSVSRRVEVRRFKSPLLLTTDG